MSTPKKSHPFITSRKLHGATAITVVTAADTSRAFYIAGGTLPGEASSYVTRQADTDLFESLLAGEYCYVLNSRQMGKSSLCVRTIGRLKQAGVRTAFCDLTRFGGRNLTAEQWYAAFLSEIGRELGLRAEFLAYWKENAGLPPVQRLFGAIADVGLSVEEAPLVVFIDEIDVTLSLPFSADEFFAAIRQCYVGRATEERLKRLSFCLLGTATPSDLIQDTKVSPFNIGKRTELRDFTLKEAAPLAQGLGEHGKILLDRVLYWTGGHPYLTQRLCRTAQEHGAQNAAEMDKLCNDLFLTHTGKESDDNLAFVRNRLLKSEVDLAALLDLYTQVQSGKRVAYDETNPLCPVLRLSGVATVRDGLLKVRNRIYDRVFDREWITAHMPDAELRRQQAAYRKGLLRAASLSFAILTVVLALSVYGEYQRRLAVRRNLEMRRNLYVAEMNQAQQALDSGNLELARQLLENQAPTQPGQEDLREFAWRYLYSRANRSDERMKLIGHQGPVESISYSPDGKMLATAGYDKTIRLWNAATGQPITVLPVQRNPVMAVAFSRDGRRLVSVDNGKGESALPGELKFWDVHDPLRPLEKTSARWEHGGLAASLAYSPNGKLLACGQLPRAVLCDSDTGREIAAIGNPPPPVGFSVAFSPDGRFLATGGNDGIMVLDVATHRERAAIEVHRAGIVYGLAVSPDGRLLASGSEDHTIRFWDTLSWKQKDVIQNSTGIRSLVFSHDGKILATGDVDGTLKLWSITEGREIARLQGHGRPITQLAFSPDGKSLATSSEDGTARVWDAVPMREAKHLQAHRASVTSLTFSTVSGLLATSSYDNTVKTWRGRRLIHAMGTPELNLPYTSVAISPNGRLLAAGNILDVVTLWDIATGEELMPRLQHDHTVTCVAISPDGRMVAAGSQGGTVKLWNAPRLLHTLNIGETTVMAVAFSPDGQRLAACCDDGSVHVWDARTGRPLAKLIGHQGSVTSVAFSPQDGKMLVTGSEDCTIRIWNTDDWKQSAMLRCRLNNVKQLAFSPDGTTLATAHGQDAITLWNVRLQKEVAILHSEEFSLNSVAFSHDGDTLAAGSATGAVRLWAIMPRSQDNVSEAEDRIQNARVEETHRAQIQREYLQTPHLEQLGTAHAMVTTENGVARVDVTAVDGTDWHVQWSKVVTGLKDGQTCVIGFRAMADRRRTVGLNTQVNGGDYHSIGFNTQVPLARIWRTYRYTFRASKPSVYNKVPTFSLGKEIGTVWIADLTAAPIATTPKPAARGAKR